MKLFPALSAIVMAGMVLWPVQASADTPSLAECAARYDHFEDYVLQAEFPDSPHGMAFDYELRAMTARTLAEKTGEPLEWPARHSLSQPSAVVWMADRAILDRCDRLIGAEPRTLGGKMFGYRSGAEITQPDNLSCFAMLTILDQKEANQAMNGQFKGTSGRYDSRALRTLASLYRVGWTQDQIYAATGPIYTRFAKRFTPSDPVNPKNKLTGDGELNRFAQACAQAYTPLDTDLAAIPLSDRDRYCHTQRRTSDIGCDDAIDAALGK